MFIILYIFFIILQYIQNYSIKNNNFDYMYLSNINTLNWLFAYQYTNLKILFKTYIKLILIYIQISFRNFQYSVLHIYIIHIYYYYVLDRYTIMLYLTYIYIYLLCILQDIVMLVIFYFLPWSSTTTSYIYFDIVVYHVIFSVYTHYYTEHSHIRNFYKNFRPIL